MSRVIAVSVASFLFICQPSSAEVLVRSKNPDAKKLPALEVSHREEWGQEFYFLSAVFPDIPGLVCDLWCFESPGIEFATAEAMDDGGIRMIHTWQDQPWKIVSVARPEPGALDFKATLEPAQPGEEAEPETYPPLNVCWQLRSATGFCSKPDPYPEFIERCFIFTEKGRTFLLDTRRRKIPVRDADDEYNNPPWVQVYLPVSSPDIRAGSQSWSDYSPDHYTFPIIGTVSRDGKYLAAIASASTSSVCQAWHDCMHNNPDWLPAKNGKGKVWHLRIYAMKNDPEALIARYRKDFPGANPK